MIYLTTSEIDFLLDKLKLDFDLKQRLNLAKENKTVLSMDDLIELDDLCKEHLETKGFDENYKTNQNGKKIEKLIDKIYHMIEGDKEDGSGNVKFGG